MITNLPDDIWIAGQFCAGKDFIAEQFIKEYNYTRLGLADELKRDVAQQNGITVEELNADKGRWRSELQRYGELQCQLKGWNYWVKRWFIARKKINERVVTPDLRKGIEIRHRPRPGLAIRVVTPFEVRQQRYFDLYGVYPTDEQLNHKSEVEVPFLNVDFEVPGILAPTAITHFVLGVLDTVDPLSVR